MGYVAALIVTGIATTLCWFASRYLDHSNLIMIYLLSIVYIATRFGRGPSIVASILSVAEFDYFCVHPQYSFAISDWQFIITFTVMLTIAILISTLTAELQDQAELGRLREKRSEALRLLSTELSITRGRDRIVEVAIRHVRTLFDAMVGIYLPDEQGRIHEHTVDKGLVKLDRQDNEVALWVFQNGQPCGLGKGEYPDASSIYLPLTATQGVLGVLQVSPRGLPRTALADELDLLETFTNLAALCIEVATLSEKAQNAAMQIEREQLRNALLSSVSHDFRTPLATITGASSSLVEGRSTLSESQKQELAQVIVEESEHLNNLVRNLLEMTRLESGALSLRKNWYSVEELVGSCMTRLERLLGHRQINIQIPRDLPLVPIDELLMSQVLLNLLENAIRYTPEGSDMDIRAYTEPSDENPDAVLLSVGDRGPGIKDGEEELIFTKFYRSEPFQHIGVGLGLAICKAILEVHGGSISARNREGGGAEFIIRIPMEGKPPAGIIETEMPDGDPTDSNEPKSEIPAKIESTEIEQKSE